MPFGIQCLNISPLHAGIFMPAYADCAQLSGQSILKEDAGKECNHPATSCYYSVILVEYSHIFSSIKRRRQKHTVNTD